MAEINVDLAKATYARLEAALDEAEARLAAAHRAIDEFDKNCPALIGVCSFCGDNIWVGDRFLQNAPSLYECWDCAPSYQDMLNDLSAQNTEPRFSNGLAAEEVQRMINDHLAAGGSLMDKVKFSTEGED